MNYLLDKKIRKNKIIKYIIFFILLFFLIYFKTSVFWGLSYTAHLISKPFLLLGNNVGEKIFNLGSYFYTKNSLFSENENLKLRLSEQEVRMENYNSLLSENLKIKEILERKPEKKDFLLASILSKPNQSVYDTLIIDIGEKDHTIVGKKVFALGNIPIGYIAEVYASTAKVILFSNPGEKTEIVISGQPVSTSASLGGDTFMQIIGRGGGNFEMILPRDFVLEIGTEVVLPGNIPFLVAKVETIISDPRDSFQKALLVSPINIQELKFVQVEK